MTITNTLPASNVIDVSITSTPSGLTAKNINALAIFTQDAPENGEAFGIYVSPLQGAQNYGTDSVTAAMLNNIFGQVPNVLSGGGYVAIIPMIGAVSATAGSFSTPNISANLAALIAVTDGSLNVTVNGVSQALTLLNFANCVTFADIAAVFNSQITDCIVTALAHGLEFQSTKVGLTSTVAITSNVTGTDLNGTGYLNGASGSALTGADSSGETIAACIARTTNLVGYVPIISTLDLEDDAVTTAASAVQALDNIFLQHFASTQDIQGISADISQAGQKKTRALVYTRGGMPAANLYKAAYAGRGFSVNFTGSNTAQTMNLKQLANVLPDNGISETLFIEAGGGEATGSGCDLYVSFDGVPSVSSNGGNDFFDNVYADLAAKFYLQTAGFNYLRQTNTKIPQTEPGMTGLKNAYRKVCNQFVTNGYWAPGAWDSSEFFGDPTIFTNNITAAGFYLYSQPVAQQNSQDRDNRIAPLVQIAAKRAGAIHKGSVLVNVND